jgi:glucose/arabinose dehydrogenase
MMSRRSLRWLAVPGLVLLLVAGIAVFLRFGPVALSDPRVLWFAVTGRSAAAPSAQVVSERLRAPPGFSIAVHADDVPQARMLLLTPPGDLIVSQTRLDRILLLGRDRDADGRPDRRTVLLEGLDRPHGLELRDGWLYYAERERVSRVRFDVELGAVSGAPQLLLDGLPADGGHRNKSLRFAPDGTLYLSVGSSCNVCIEEDERRATIMRLQADGTQAQIFARGLRNSIGMDFAPWDGALYATDNGRDLLGDDFPPCELNRIEQDGFYGWPFINGFGRLDPDLGAGRTPLLATSRSPVHGFRAHNAPLGIRFLRARQRAPGFERAALVALHGSWNRSTPDGYRVVSLHWRDDGRIEERPFLWGFLEAGSIIGRPVDIAESEDGTLYVSDDYAGVIYRVRYCPGAACRR